MFEDREDNEVKIKDEKNKNENRKYSTVGRKSVWEAEGGEEPRTHMSSLTHWQAKGGNGEEESRKHQVKTESEGGGRSVEGGERASLPSSVCAASPPGSRHQGRVEGRGCPQRAAGPCCPEAPQTRESSSRVMKLRAAAAHGLQEDAHARKDQGLGWRALTGVGGAQRLSGDKLGTVDELGEVRPRGADDGRGRDGPAFRVRFTADLIVRQLHLFAALQSLEQRKPSALTPQPPPEELTEYLHDEVDVHGEGLNSVEAGNEGDGEEALGVHLPPQEEVPLQVVEAEVVLTAAVDTDGTDKTKGR